MARVKKMGVSPLSNTIYYGTVDTEKEMWVGKKVDVTDTAIKAVFEWFMNCMIDNNYEEYSISFPNTEFKLAMTKKTQEEIAK